MAVIQQQVAQRQALVVLGMHRSGTSALGGMLAKLGAKAPRTLMRPTAFNPRGYWESKELLRANDRILKSAGSHWNDWGPFDLDWIDPAAAAAFDKIVGPLIEKEYGDAPLILIKDPRICRFFPLWHESLARLGIATQVIIPVRHPMAVARSLEQRDQFGRDHSLLLWLRHMLDAEGNTRTVPRSFVSYQHILENWQQVADKIVRDLGIEWPREPEDCDADISTFLSPRLCHHRPDGAPVAANAQLSAWMRQTWDTFGALADGSAESAEALDDLARIREAFDQSSVIYASVVRENERRIEQMHEEMSAYLHGLAMQLGHSRGSRQTAACISTGAAGTPASPPNDRSTAAHATAAASPAARNPISARADQQHAAAPGAPSRASGITIPLAGRGSREAIRMHAAADHLHSRLSRLLDAMSEAAAALRSRDQEVAGLTTELKNVKQALASAKSEQDRAREQARASTRDVATLTRMALGLDSAACLPNAQARQAAPRHPAPAPPTVNREQALGEYRVAAGSRAQDMAAGTGRSQTARWVHACIWKLYRWRHGGRVHPDVAKQQLRGPAGEDLAQVLDESSLFDAPWYLDRYPEAGSGGQKPAEHYLLHGAAQGFNPGPGFDTVAYLVQHADVRRNGTNPLVHFLLHGEAEGRTTFDVDGNPETSVQRETALVRDAGMFDQQWYLAHYPDMARLDIDPIVHYLRIGARMLRDPGPGFRTAAYLTEYPDVGDSGMNPLVHYLKHGRDEGRNPAPVAMPHRKAPEHPAAADTRPARHTYREFPGRKAPLADTRTILVCAHVAGTHLFGAERSLLDILDGLTVAGYNVVTALPGVGNREYLEALRERCRSVISFRYDWWRRHQVLDQQAVAEFARVIADLSIDAVHVNTIMLREPLAAARRMGVPAVVHVRELIEHDTALCKLIGDSPQRITSKVLESADWVIANSEATGRSFAKAGAVHVIPNTVDAAHFSQGGERKANTIRVGLVSSNLPKKGIHDFVAVARLLADGHPELRFLLIGPENEHTRAFQAAQATGAGEVPGNIEIAGYRKDPAQAMTDIDVLVNLSHFQESFGRTVLEAMAAGLPVIVYDWGALPELVIEGATGFVVPFRDVDAVAARLTRLCLDPSAIKAMGITGRKRVLELYDKPNFARHMRRAYEQIFEHAETRPAPPLTLDARRLAPGERTDRRLRIAYFLWHFPVPSETFVLNELRILVARGHDVHVYCRDSPHKDFKPDFPIEWTSVKDPEDLAGKLVQSKREIVHSHFTYPTVTEMVWPACELAEVPFTFIAHAQDIFRYRNDERNRIGEIGRSSWCLRVLVPSRFHRAYVEERGVPAGKLLINPNGIDPGLYTSAEDPDHAPRSKRSICAIHRFTEKKGLEHLIGAGKALADDGITIHIHGYGELESAYRDLIQAEGLDNVVLHGPVKSRKEMLALFREHDLFACPSVRAADGDMDGIPTVLMEAMASGMPVLTSDASGIPDLVRDGVTGMVCSADADAIVRAVRRFYAMPDGQVRAMIDDARELIRHKFDAKALTATLVRLWRQQTIDIMIVSWNNPRQLREVVRRIQKFTMLPFHLVICDNGSDREVAAWLCKAYADFDNTSIIFNRDNSFVGPGTNICLEHGQSDYAVYVCGKEGFVLDYAWENKLIGYMDAHPKVGLAGTRCHAPDYLTGAMYPKGIALFEKFRNRQFASDNPQRKFVHIQGGFFVIRRDMYDEIGGFSDAVPHSYTDVEYSYHVESSGWQLGTPPGLLALFNKTRPGLFSRIDESIAATHPPMLEDLPLLDRMVDGTMAHCNLCSWHGNAFDLRDGQFVCPGCGATPADRSVYRLLAESMLMYRRLPAIGFSVGAAMHAIWKQQFQGRMMNEDEFRGLLDGGHKLDFGDGNIKLVYLDHDFDGSEFRRGAFKELERVLADDAMIVTRGIRQPEQAQALSRACKLHSIEPLRYSSSVVRYDWAPLYVGRRCEVTRCVS